jgi:hypothetical protein
MCDSDDYFIVVVTAYVHDDGATTNLAVFDVTLLCNRAIDEDNNAFAAIRTVNVSFNQRIHVNDSFGVCVC